MANRDARPNSVLSAVVAIVAGAANLLLLAFAKQYIDDLVGLMINVYAYLSVPICAYGLVGIVTGKPKFIAVFANFLLLDAAVWALVRLVIAQFFLMFIFDDEVCGGYNPTWSSDNFHLEIVAIVQRFRAEQIGYTTHTHRCQVQVGAYQIIVVFMLLALTAAHGSMAMAMRRHAKEVEKQQQQQQHAEVIPESEKGTLALALDNMIEIV